MAQTISYRTDLGVVAAARAQHLIQTQSSGTNRLESGSVQQVSTAAGLDLFVASLLATVHAAQVGLQDVEEIQRLILDNIHVSTSRNIAAILKETAQLANETLHQDPRWHGGGLTAVIAVIYGKRLYLAQIGNSRAYLVRDSRAILLTQDQTLEGSIADGATISTHGGEALGPGSLLRYLGKDRNVFVDTQVHLPEGGQKAFLDLGASEGLILCTSGVVERVLRQDNLLDEGFLNFYQNQEAGAVADRLISILARQNPAENHAVIVLKNDEEAAPVPVFGTGSCVSQVGIIASILVISILLGLAAAFGLPAVMNPKSSSIPNSGANLAQPGYLSVASTEGVAQITLPGQAPQNMTPGTLVEAKDGSQITTARGKAKIELVDGTTIYIAGSSSLTLKQIANPKINQNGTLLVLDTGGVIVDTSRTSDVVSVLLTVPGTARGSAIGQFIGATYQPEQKRLDVDCLEGNCHMSGATASRDMNVGQRSWVMNGVIGGLETARWDLWAGVCDSDCPFQSQASAQPVPQTTPTFLPTLAVPIPYLGAETGNSSPAR